MILNFLSKLEICDYLSPFRRARRFGAIWMQNVSIVLACSDHSYLHTLAPYDARWWIACKMIRVVPSHWIYCEIRELPLPVTRRIMQDFMIMRALKYSQHRDFPQNGWCTRYFASFVFYKGEILTSNARRDIAMAKNMQITIPANVRYLGPISSRAATKFTVQKSFAFRTSILMFLFMITFMHSNDDWKKRSNLSDFSSSLNSPRSLCFALYFCLELNSLCDFYVCVTTYRVWKVFDIWQEKRDHSRSSAPCRSRNSDWSSWRWKISLRETGWRKRPSFCPIYRQSNRTRRCRRGCPRRRMSST